MIEKKLYENLILNQNTYLKSYIIKKKKKNRVLISNKKIDTNTNVALILDTYYSTFSYNKAKLNSKFKTNKNCILINTLKKNIKESVTKVKKKKLYLKTINKLNLIINFNFKFFKKINKLKLKYLYLKKLVKSLKKKNKLLTKNLDIIKPNYSFDFSYNINNETKKKGQSITISNYSYNKFIRYNIRLNYFIFNKLNIENNSLLKQKLITNYNKQPIFNNIKILNPKNIKLYQEQEQKNTAFFEKKNIIKEIQSKFINTVSYLLAINLTKIAFNSFYRQNIYCLYVLCIYFLKIKKNNFKTENLNTENFINFYKDINLKFKSDKFIKEIAKISQKRMPKRIKLLKILKLSKLFQYKKYEPIQK